MSKNKKQKATKQHNKLFFVRFALLSIIGFAVHILAVSVIVQIYYPANQALPNAKLFDQSVGYKTTDEINQRIINDFESAKVVLKTDNKEKEITLRNLGLNVNSDFMTSKLSEYSLRERLVPLSILFKKPDQASFDVISASSQQSEVLAELADFFSAEAKNAQLNIQDGKIVINDGQTGIKINIDDLKNKINSASYNQASTEIDVASEVTKPDVSKADLTPAYEKAVAYSEHEITIIGRGQSYTLTPDAVVKMLSIDKQASETKVIINESELAKHLEATAGKFYEAPTPSIANLVDGVETSRKNGDDGSAVDSASLKNDIQTALDSPELNATIEAKFVSVAPETIFQRSYTNSEKGLQAFLAYQSSISDVRIYLQQLDGKGWSAGTRETEATVSASTYKLYVAILVFNKINSGDLKLSDKILDKTVESCLEEMLIVSANRCAEEWIAQFGRDYINNYFHGRGISGATSFTHPVAVHTSAKDLFSTLKGIYDGSLLADPGRTMLLDRLARQNHRKGIPSGTTGWAQDKVGYLWSYTHDVGVVHTTKGNYILAVMTKNNSFSGIAEITRKIEEIMYP